MHQKSTIKSYLGALEEGTIKFKCVDIFEFDKTLEKIAKITIIYDSASTRQAFSELQKE
jgi:hypothetical protein